MILGPVTLYTHASSAEDYEWYYEQAQKDGWSEADLEELKKFLDLRPLYEVTFRFVLDTNTGEAHCTEINIGNGEPPFTRPYPGQQLSLLEGDS